jgi:hypothetical protein
MAVQAWSRDVVRCARCGYTCPADVWCAQPPQRTLTRADVAGHVLGWPADAVVEIRACARCGASIARRGRAH